LQVSLPVRCRVHPYKARCRACGDPLANVRVGYFVDQQRVARGPHQLGQRVKPSMVIRDGMQSPIKHFLSPRQLGYCLAAKNAVSKNPVRHYAVTVSAMTAAIAATVPDTAMPSSASAISPSSMYLAHTSSACTA